MNRFFFLRPTDEALSGRRVDLAFCGLSTSRRRFGNSRPAFHSDSRSLVVGRRRRRRRRRVKEESFGRRRGSDFRRPSTFTIEIAFHGWTRFCAPPTTIDNRPRGKKLDRNKNPHPSPTPFSPPFVFYCAEPPIIDETRKNRERLLFITEKPPAANY